MSLRPDLAGHLIGREPPLVRNVFGPTVEILTMSSDDADAPALLRGTLPPGVVVPMHAHDEPETFYVLHGRLQGLVVTPTDAGWLSVNEGQIFHVPSNARHALRNTASDPAVALIISRPSMADFFERMGVPLDSPESPGGPPTMEDLERMARLTAERGDWTASPEENAAVGIELPPPPNG